MFTFRSLKHEAYALLLLVFMLSGLVIWVRTATVKDTYLYVQHERELRLLEQETQAIRVRWLKLTSPKRLELIATGLGLAPPKLHQIVKFQASRTIPERGKF